MNTYANSNTAVPTKKIQKILTKPIVYYFNIFLMGIKIIQLEFTF